MRQSMQKKYKAQHHLLHTALLFVLLVFVSGFGSCFEEQEVSGYRYKPGQVFLPRVETLEMGGIEGIGAVDIEHALVRELLRSTSYAIYDGRYAQLSPLLPMGFDSEMGSVARSAVIFGTVTQNQMTDRFVSQNQNFLATMYTRKSAVQMAVALRFVDKHTNELLDSSVIEFVGELPDEVVGRQGPELQNEDEIASLFSPRDEHAIFQEGYANLANTLSQQLQGQTELVSVRLFISNRMEAYDFIGAASDMAQRGDWRGAAASYRRAFSRLEHDGMPNVGVAARLQANLAACYSMLGRLEEAVALYTKALNYEYVASIAQDKERCERWLQQAQDAESVVHEK